MVDEQRLRELEERYEGYTVVDNSGDKIGKVDDLFVDDADNEEYLGVKMGLFGLSGTTLIPMELCQADESNRQIMVNDTKEHVKNAPNFRDDDEITAEYEERIRQHFGLSSAAPSADRGSYGRYEGGSGAAGAGAAGAAGATGAGAGASSRGGDYDDERYSGRPEGGVQERGVASPSTEDVGRPDDDRYSGAAMGGINRKEQAEPISPGPRPGGEPGDTSFGGTGGPGAASDEGAPVGGEGYEGRGESGGLSGTQRGDYDHGYDEGYRRAMEERSSSQGGEGGSGSGGSAMGGQEGYGGESSGRTRVRRRIQRLT